jgi:UDP-glucose 4-epimerase
MDLEDVVSAHLVALERRSQSTSVYIISATTPFTREDLFDLRMYAPLAVKRIYAEQQNPHPYGLRHVVCCHPIQNVA